MDSMPDYTNMLLRAINNYDENDKKSIIALRDLICIISENDEIEKSPLLNELLYVASQKMRVFGYNVQNGFYNSNIEIDRTASELSRLRNYSIVQHYQSKVRRNNILDKSQKEIIDFFQSLSMKRMLVSAPTSYGKTFIMREILYLNRHRYKNILLVFPTVALLRENALNMEELNREKEMGYKVIKSIDSQIDIGGKNIFVFTPERTMQLLAKFPQLVIDFFFYDEMYKIDEDYCNEDTDDEVDLNKKYSQSNYTTSTFLDEARAKTFRICLYLLSKKVKEYYLAGPNLKKEKFGYGMKKYLETNHIYVKEIDFEPTKRIQVNAYNSFIDENYIGIEYLEKPKPVKLSSKVNDRICDIVNYIKERKYGSTMLYCTTPAKANSYAKTLSDNYLGKIVNDKEYEIFISHLERAYNIDNSVQDWSFFKVLKRGFGMHHGKMPKYIQKEVLDLFNRGVFDLLFCTSTIVEGVNTNAKNMVILNHTKGSNDLTVFDFKNIIGRAGRYYHNFLGRYFLFDKKLAKFNELEDSELNFVTYDKQEIHDIDIDNSEMEDLEYINKIKKTKRLEMQKQYLLPESVFVQNRLIKIEYQEQLLNYILTDDGLFDKFYEYLKYPDILLQFTKYNAMNIVIDYFEKAKLLDEITAKRYKAISYTYCNEGFKGLLKYQIDNARKNKKTIDRAYMDAFKTQKEIIEHKIPKLLALFESIYSYAASVKKIEFINFSLSRVSRFYETGVKSLFGEGVVEYGFPVDAIKRIEDTNVTIMDSNMEEAKLYILQHWEKVCRVLDAYERILLEKAIKSL